MPDRKLTDNEIIKAREVSLKEQIEHCNERLKETLDSYYRRNTNGVEDPLEICVLRESGVLISKLESIINRLQAENEKYEGIKEQLGVFWDLLLKLSIAKRKEKPTLEEFAEALQVYKAEAYKEFAERLDNETFGVYYASSLYHVVDIDDVKEILKELVGDGGCNTCQSLACDGCELYEEAESEDNA